MRLDKPCRMCVHDEPMCMATKDSQDHTFICTRYKGHAGLHMACGGILNGHPSYSWSPYTKKKDKSKQMSVELSRDTTNIVLVTPEIKQLIDESQEWYDKVFKPAIKRTESNIIKEKSNGRPTVVSDMVDNRTVQESSAPGVFSLQGGNPANDSGGS